MTTRNDHYRVFWQKTAQEGARLLRIFGGTQEVILPTHIAGYPLTELGDYCFAQKTHLPSEGNYFINVIHPAGDHASPGNPENTGHLIINNADDIMAEAAGSFITYVSLPDTLIKVGDYAFYDCRELSRIEFGSRLNAIGSDAFMNCHKLGSLHIRCGATAKSGLRRILAQIPWDVEVSFLAVSASGCTCTEAAVFYPEYYESYDEIAPAHIFGRKITGEGFRARQCFKDGAVDHMQYDTVFQKACAGESAGESIETMCHLALCRLRYPIGLAGEMKAQYECYIRAHGKMLCRQLIAEKQLDALSDLFSQRLLPAEDAQHAILYAAEAGWTEGSASMMRWKQTYYQAPVRSRYGFEDF